MQYNLPRPLSEADVRQLKLEDTVTIDGVMFGIRDATQIRIFDEGIAPPADLQRRRLPAHRARRPQPRRWKL